MPARRDREKAPSIGALLAPSVERVLSRTGRSLRNPEGVHDLRVACRRLRVGLWLFRDVVGGKRRKQLDSDLARLADALGPVREWDVLIESRPAGSPDVAEMQSQRLRALAQARRRLSGRQGRELRRRLRRLRARLTEEADLRSSVTPDRIDAAVKRRVGCMRREVVQARSGESEALHRLRLQVKKMRYCLELLRGGVAGSGPWTAELDVLRQAQAQLGDWNDGRFLAARGAEGGQATRAQISTLLRRLVKTCASLEARVTPRARRP